MSVAVAVLVLGYLLSVPPLFRLRHAWRTRWWLAYTAEVVGAALVTLGWLLYGGRMPAVFINGAWTVAFGIAFPLFAGSGRR
ncbi:MAG: hypothetical protein U5Q44_11945 [Dehalococcoidia bacterium]|nr:hypothetical protein [Dehalococcoidia bacterium]